jgi:hypothetical protein
MAKFPAEVSSAMTEPMQRTWTATPGQELAALPVGEKLRILGMR